jgi:hypothetical protein
MKIKWLLLVIAFVILGFFQELIKVNVNYVIEQGSLIEGFFDKGYEERITALADSKRNNPFDYYHSHTPIDALQLLALGQLKALKWVLTILFVVIFFLLNRKALGWLIKDERMNKWLLSTYFISFGSAFFIYGLGYVFGSMDLFYNISRKMVGALQSPVPAMMNWAAWQLYIQQSKK